MQVFTPSRHSAETDNNTVLILRDSVPEKKTEGGIWIADRAIELASQGEVRASVDGSQYEAGQRIVFVKYSGAELELNGVMYVLLKEKEIQGTVREVEDRRPAATAQEGEDAMQKALAEFERTGKG